MLGRIFLRLRVWRGDDTELDESKDVLSIRQAPCVHMPDFLGTEFFLISSEHIVLASRAVINNGTSSEA